MLKIRGPFLKNSKDGMWHWIKLCPNFPSLVNPETKISKSADEKNLCPICLGIQNKKESAFNKEDY